MHNHLGGRKIHHTLVRPLLIKALCALWGKVTQTFIKKLIFLRKCIKYSAQIILDIRLAEFKSLIWYIIYISLSSLFNLFVFRFLLMDLSGTLYELTHGKYSAWHSKHAIYVNVKKGSIKKILIPSVFCLQRAFYLFVNSLLFWFSKGKLAWISLRLGEL